MIFVIAILLLSTIGVVILYNSQGKIKSVVIAELNRSLKSEISVQEIDFVIFKSFPYVSLQFKNILGKEVYNPYQEKDTLFYAGNASLKFNALDILSRNYRIKQIDIRDAGFYMKYFKDSVANYEFWTKSKDTSSSEFQFSLQKIRFYNTRYIFHNEVTKQHYDFLIKNGIARGDFSSTDQNIALKSSLHINFFQTGKIILFKQIASTVDVNVLHLTKEKSIVIKKGNLELQKLPFFVSGSYCYAKDNSMIDLSIKSNKICLDRLIQFLPQEVKKSFQGYKSTGILDMSVSISEQANLRKLPLVSASFVIKNGALSGKKTPVKFRNINLSGTFTNGKKRNSETCQLRLENISTHINQGNIKGDLLIRNFNNPFINANLSANLNLFEVHQFLKTEPIENIKGGLHLDISIKGTADQLKKTKAYALNQVNINGTVEFGNVFLKLKNNNPEIKNLQAKLIFNNQTASVSNAKFLIGSSDVSLEGRVSNILPFIFIKDEPLNISASLSANKLLLEEFFPPTSKSDKKVSKEKTANNFLGIPKNIEGNLTLYLGKFSYKNIKAESVKTNLELKPNYLYIKDVRLNALNGEIAGNLLFNNASNNKSVRVSGEMNLKTIDVGQLFYTFDNFGSKALTSDNLKGNITANTVFSFLYYPEKGIDQKSLQVVSDTKIENGALLNFKPMSKLSYFVEDETLKNIHFKTLTNTFRIQNETIEIPRMEIKSNVMNFEISGKHKFNNEIYYQLKIKLSELSSKKQKARLAREQKEFGNFEEDNSGRLTLYVIVTGTLDNPIFKYDSKSAKAQMKENFQKEKENMKNILKNEFSGSEADRKDKENWKKQEEGNYIINWEEREDSNDKKKDRKEKKFNIEWE